MIQVHDCNTCRYLRNVENLGPICINNMECHMYDLWERNTADLDYSAYTQIITVTKDDEEDEKMTKKELELRVAACESDISKLKAIFDFHKGLWESKDELIENLRSDLAIANDNYQASYKKVLSLIAEKRALKEELEYRDRTVIAKRAPSYAHPEIDAWVCSDDGTLFAITNNPNEMCKTIFCKKCGARIDWDASIAEKEQERVTSDDCNSEH